MLHFLYMCRKHFIEVRSNAMIHYRYNINKKKHKQKVDEILRVVEKLKMHMTIVESDIKDCEVISLLVSLIGIHVIKLIIQAKWLIQKLNKKKTN